MAAPAGVGEGLAPRPPHNAVIYLGFSRTLAGSVLGPMLIGPGGSSPLGLALDRLLAQRAMKSADLSRSIGGDPAVHIQPG
jgi:hypothetical protein